jgi:cysteine-rich repeat protein
MMKTTTTLSRWGSAPNPALAHANRFACSPSGALALGVLSLIAVVACSAQTNEEAQESSSQALSTCGDGVREGDEHCDDDNTGALDGCSSTCKMEQIHRFNAIEMQFNTDAFCSANGLGGAVRGPAQSKIRDALNAKVVDGSLSVLLSFGNLTDLSGASATPTSNLVLGSFIGTPAAPAIGGQSYNGASDLDWVYAPDPATIDANRKPIAFLNGSIANRALTAGPGNMAFALALGADTATNVNLSNVRLKASIGPVSAPSNHLPTEHLDPTLKSFASMTGGQLCGNVSAASLAKLPVPDALMSGGEVGCSEGYGATNTMLDVFVSGCRALFITLLDKTQPDQQTNAPVVGSGAPYKLTVDASKHVSVCKDKNGATAALDACLDGAGYSTAFKFVTGRVIAR